VKERKKERKRKQAATECSHWVSIISTKEKKKRRRRRMHERNAAHPNASPNATNISPKTRKKKKKKTRFQLMPSLTVTQTGSFNKQRAAWTQKQAS
jgi:hypothetical protein